MRPITLLLALLFTGCAALPERPAVDDAAAAFAVRQAALERIATWDLRGRLALRTAQEGVHASVYWQHDRAMHRIDLAGPFGGGRARITLDGDGAELRDANGKVYRDASVQVLLARVTGWWLPLESLRYWIVGLPAPQAPVRTELDEWGRLKTLRQLGWDVQYLEYVSQGDYELPRRVFIQRADGVDADAALEARIVIEQWRVDGATPGVGAK